MTVEGDRVATVDSNALVWALVIRSRKHLRMGRPRFKWFFEVSMESANAE